MRRIFLDTFYLQALVDTGNNAHELATVMTAKLGIFQSITSEMILTELLNALSNRGKYLRKSAIRLN